MTEKIYQVFISSTYEDLKEERAAAQQALIANNCMPIGMEGFPSSDLEQFKYIKRVLEYVDYYVLIIGGRYGSIHPETSISYTEMEYDYAVEKGIPVLMFIKDSSVITKNNTDNKDMELEKFIDKASNNKMRNTFISCEDLKYKIISSINSEKILSPREGWIKASFGNPIDLLEENRNLRKEVDFLKEQLSNLEKDNELDISFLDGEFKLNIEHILYYSSAYSYIDENEILENSSFKIGIKELFIKISEYYFSNAQLGYKDLNLIIDDIYKELFRDDYNNYQDISVAVFNEINSKRDRFMKYKDNRFEVNLTKESKQMLVKFLLSNELVDKENNGFKLNSKGTSTYKKIIE